MVGGTWAGRGRGVGMSGSGRRGVGGVQGAQEVGVVWVGCRGPRRWAWCGWGAGGPGGGRDVGGAQAAEVGAGGGGHRWGLGVRGEWWVGIEGRQRVGVSGFGGK